MNRNISDMQFDPPLPPMMVEITLHEYSQLNRQVGFLEGTLSGLSFVENDWTSAVHEAIARYEEQFSPMFSIEIPPATDRSPTL